MFTCLIESHHTEVNTINRPGVARADLQIFLLLINSFIPCGNLFNKPSFRNRKTKGAEMLREGSHPPNCHVSCVTCHVLRVVCHNSFLSFFWTLW